MAADHVQPNPGLDGIIAAETVLSEVDGAEGRLTLRGRPIGTLAGQASFEAVVGLLWADVLPGGAAADLPARLGRARAAAFDLALPLLPRLGDRPPVAALRVLLAALPTSTAAEEAVLATAAVGTFVAAHDRVRRGLPPVPPDPALPHAADVLRMRDGRTPRAADAAALETYLVTVMDHGLNASTFAARVVASTGAPVPAVVTAALCALEGPLHGGAPGPVLDMLDAVGTPENAAAWVEARLAAGERLMGFGHRVYRVRDPRADVLKRALAVLRRARGDRDEGRAALAAAVEAAALDALARRRPGRRLETNVEFGTAMLLDALGFGRDLFTPLFATGRVAGWVAHAAEQVRTGRLIRPESRYVGPGASARRVA